MTEIEISAELSIDKRTVDEVHADLIRKRNQLEEQVGIVTEARMFIENTPADVHLDKGAILAILSKGLT